MGRNDKAKKGTVSITSDRGMLRLRWRVNGQRYSLALGFPDTKQGRLAAQRRASEIELDILSGHFDTTLARYKPERGEKEETNKEDSGTVVGVFERYTEHKAKRVQKRTLSNYNGTTNALRDFFGDTKLAKDLTAQDVEAFVDWYRKSGSVVPLVVKERLVKIKSAWDWAIDEGLVTHHPWWTAHKLVKVPPKQPPKPFSPEEISRILKALRTDRYYWYLHDYFLFSFGTGCRPGEVIGLRWQHLADDCSTAWIGETLTRGERKATKTNEARTIKLSEQVQTMLRARREWHKQKGWGVTGDNLVFTSPNGRTLDDHNIRNRAWEPILNRLSIPYRKPYTTRSTFITHCLLNGMKPLVIAEYTGHDIEVLYDHYAGYIQNDEDIPDLF